MASSFIRRRGPALGEKYQPQPPIYLRNIEKGKKEKKSWYQYVFLGLAWEHEATEEVRGMGASSPIPSDQSTQTLSVKLLRKAAWLLGNGVRGDQSVGSAP